MRLIMPVIVLVCGVVHSLKYNLDNSETLFEEFVTNFNKTYSSQDEKLIRYEIFKKNLALINNKNMESKHATFDINIYSDLHKNDLLHRTTGLRIGLKKNPLFKAITFRECGVQVIGDEPHALLPETFDWRLRNGVTSVKDQLQCGACWAFSALGNIESLHKIKYGVELDLSEQHLVNCDPLNNGCDGGLMHWALENILYEGGLVAERDEPYFGYDAVCKPKRLSSTISGCTRFVLQNENRLRELLVVNGPVSVAIDVIDVIDYKEGIADMCHNKNGLNHAVLLVGYGVDNDVPYWILKNSWGENWGENGFFRVQRNVNSCGIMNEYASSAIL
ncbi:cathepsin [Clostera anachoreta granulovirus]|uniref:Viral cathepsin n=1 Tax=Clostera anachoreta granulovirus TaxID=283675 RepID=E7CU96_9BBAC|nr:cathepsin [Clostera anachoreta granulovirus]ADU24593.1 cathepsin [Clostera anachoreta granulovirus]AEB00299.1 cathepsin [Clostera anachoreta granulovirus]